MTGHLPHTGRPDPGLRPGAPAIAPRIFALAATLRRSFNAEAAPRTGLSHEKARILILIGDFQPVQMADLAQHTSLDPGQLSRGISELVAAGLARREARGRTRVLSLTEAGAPVYAELGAYTAARNAELLQDLDTAAQAGLCHALDLILSRADAMLDRDRDGPQDGPRDGPRAETARPTGGHGE
ncbi:MarR family winged helix-turn-helix transcriptional regulator [Mesobaculum littorinae]|nr:MarR family winged helix-turn-helix transcriptional regulator [Mesobaculum littorinae]